MKHHRTNMTSLETAKSRQSSDRIAAILTLFAVATAVAAAVYFARTGFDITDEGYYLASISDPEHYVASLSFFGEMYHPAFVMLRGNIVALRVLSLAVSVTLSIVLSILVVRRYFVLPAGPTRVTRIEWVYALGIATSALSIASLNGKWLATPSYNSLAFAGLLVAAIATVLCVSAHDRPSTFAWVLLGIGGWLSFMGKSSTAALLAVATLLVLITARKATALGLLVAISSALGLLVISAYLFSGSLIQFGARFALGLHLLRLQNAGYDPMHALARLWEIPTGPRALSIYVLASCFLAHGWFARGRQAHVTFAALFAGALVSSAVVYRKGIGNAYAKEAFIQLLWAISVLGGCLWLAAGSRFRNVRELGRPTVALSIYLIALPEIYAFGTSNNYLTQANMACVFWVLACVLFASTLFNSSGGARVLPLIILFVSVSSALTVFMAAESPYRQEAPLRNARELVQIGATRTEVLVGTGTATFLRNVQSATTRAGFPVGQPTIDLTGGAPGTIYAWGGEGVGLAWMLSHLNGSRETILTALQHVPCSELVAAWVLGSTSQDASDPELLTSFGALLQRDYMPVATWVSLSNDGVETLYRPIRSIAAAARICDSGRASQGANLGR